jgi:hypothetical protein
MVEAEASSFGNGLGVGTDGEEQQFVVGPATGKSCRMSSLIAIRFAPQDGI